MSSTDEDDLSFRDISRREFLRRTAAAGLSASAGGAFLAKGASAESRLAALGAAQPKRGGNLRVGMVGAGSGESFNPALSGANMIGAARAYSIFDTLVRNTPNPALIAPGLAVEWSHNARATAWQFRLRPDVTFHDGKPLTPEDVIYSLRFMGAPSNGAAPVVANISMKDLKKTGPSTVVVPLKSPDVLFPYNLTGCVNAIVQDGAKDFTHPIGTGGFRFVSLVTGQRSICSRNPNYWDDGKPYVDTLEIVSIDDDSARLNALLGGQIDVMAQLPFTQARSQQSGHQINVLSTPSVVPYAFYVRTDVKPFNDIRVRQALKLIPDREALINIALDGWGTVANDLFGKGLPYYASSIPQRHQDIDQAKALLRRAGYPNLRVTLNTSPVAAGFVEAATLFAQQAKQAGVRIDIKTNPANAYFDPSLLYTKQSFAQTEWNASTLSQFYNYALSAHPADNETHWHNPAFWKLLQEAISATDASTARSRWFEVQEIQWNQGGYIMYANIDIIDASSLNVIGITPSRIANLGLPTGLIDASFK
jgi:peptide/nickel transport system substrate-binding protein